MLVGMPILTAFKYYDVGKNITDLRFAEIVSVTVVNEMWFQSQTDDVEEGDHRCRPGRRAGGIPLGRRECHQDLQDLDRQWRRHQHAVEADQQKMDSEFQALATKLVDADPAVKEEYERLKALVDAKAK